ncbi:amidohydrolase family protein [Kineosporia sp. J2-2]|uniref:Amidohydrolase family protein n=1 Tax=Kineosporia corallincola TaxID=2835133 RepID=A0ABS5TC89_9ACTN|nr:amidohydrolase family protein [Kineosporia corallincola]MBT0768458.1 amidohydrolase family protein [Kineosporia corallincola]
MLTDSRPAAGHLTGLPVWDGTRDLGPADVSWSADGTLTAVAPVAPATAAAGTGLTVIPGLIDTHVHLVGNASAARADFLGWPLVTRPEERTLHGLAQAQRALRGGVTTVRDLSADDIQFSLRRALEQDVVTGPRVLAFGMVSMTGGHGDLFTPAAVRERPPVADGPDACRALVRHWARSGADGIKIATSGGVLSVGDKHSWRNHTPAEIAAIVDEAHALGLRVAAHAHTAEGVRVALEHGADSIEHGTLITAGQAERAAAAGVTLAPTLLINDRIAAGTGVTPEQQHKAAELVGRRDAALRAAEEAGLEIVLGTDANGYHVRFGDQMDEVRAMAGLFGWSAGRALEAATSRAASAVGLDGVTGSLRAGLCADLLVVRGRPAHDLADLRPENLVAVVSRGRVVAGQLPSS